jgi:hypothetical protein
MSLLSPLSLAWLGLLAPLIGLYILRRRREARVVGSTLLWDRAVRDMRAERPWQRLIPYLSLILQALAILLAAQMRYLLSVVLRRALAAKFGGSTSGFASASGSALMPTPAARTRQAAEPQPALI